MATNNQHATNTPYVFAHSLGQQLDMSAQEFPTANADGLPVVNLTQEQKYLFDTRGWLLIPGVLTKDETEEMREFCLRLQHDPDSIPEHERSTAWRPASKAHRSSCCRRLFERICSLSASVAPELLRIPHGVE